MTVSADVPDALAIAWDAFKDAAGDDLAGWELTAAAAEAVVDDVSRPAARLGPYTVSGRARLTVRVHARARTERLEWDGATLQLWVHEPPADGRANAAVIRAAAR
jgi:hypothetical protein